ncbi:Dihydroorotate dehydrogenase (quinone) [Candidatus Terasakiella magnetica]|uniref:Dihydroorotate dehydrogenase (quinone) n=1 Tax=Candidatus Terasakiella magnetica TaxID=1867952 RepID=A0A1C3RKZ0_9PROT|nr:quinone-dependent dihydroorotate dehydrogenase [Candidatus Terasakiella magnetica]SCA57923.1 Dihydroorotate dehydrogenase (quinone) [Candidatus Terasakiella magnetica]
MGLYALAGPLLRLVSPEKAHGLAITALKNGLLPKTPAVIDPILAQSLWGMDFKNPVGLAAGFDKNAEVPDAILGQGFGFTEIGSVTPIAQPGNPQPRLFRLSDDQAVINRMGFNNEGLEAVAARLKSRARNGIVGANLGKNKTQEDAAADYVAGTKALAGLSDYLVVNVSSPNTPGLRALQSKDQLAALLNAVLVARNETVPQGKAPLLLKVAPDLTDEDKADIVDVALQTGIDGMIVSNTTIERPESLTSADKGEGGGLSGQPLFEPSTQVLKEIAKLVDGRFPLIGVGGISNADQAYAKIRAGASLVQLYSALVYGGLELVGEINRGLVEHLKRDGFENIKQAVGADL